MDSSEEFINFDSFAVNYDDTRAVSDTLLMLFFKSFLEVNDQPTNSLKKILEIGCGTGRVSRIFALNKFNVTGVDVSRNMLDKAIEKSKKENWDFTGVLSDARELPFEDNEFDIVYCVHVLHLIKDWKRVIAEALRCSKSKRFVNVNLERTNFSTPIMKNYWQYLTYSGFATNYNTSKKIGAQNSEEIVKYMQSIGFNSVKSEFDCKITMEREKLIEITNLKAFSSQRFIPDEIHKLAIQYLEKNDYFLPTDRQNVELSEKGNLYSFFKKKY